MTPVVVDSNPDKIWCLHLAQRLVDSEIVIREKRKRHFKCIPVNFHFSVIVTSTNSNNFDSVFQAMVFFDFFV